MKANVFQEVEPEVQDNTILRTPQREAYQAIAEHVQSDTASREMSVVLPVGCGKSGLVALAPFATGSRRALVVAPNLNIARQLLADLTPSDPKYFYTKRQILSSPPFPETAEIRGTGTNRSDLDDADIVVTNIQQLQRENNRWLDGVDEDFFDLIIFDEAHHNVADSWEVLRAKFPDAKIVNVSATPARADGRIMSGDIIYSYPISEAVKNGFVKRVSGNRLNPKSLRYVRREDDREIEVGLDEVRRLGEQDASFRRSIVSSQETLDTIVDASIRKLHELRGRSGEQRLKIIASALNMEHCKQIVASYTERGLRADFVHSKQDGKANQTVHDKLERHELDVIVQVRKLGEGFDHPFLAVAAVFSIFSNLSPFVQFVGRVMRILPDTDPKSNVNDAVVVFHVGANITGVWNDFQEFAEADREWFAALVDEHIDGSEDTVGPPGSGGGTPQSLPEILAQGDVMLEDIDLLHADPDVAAAIATLRQAGIETGHQFDQLNKIHTTKQSQRQAKRKLLDERVKTKVGQILAEHDSNPVGRDLDRSKRKENFQVVKASIDRAIKKKVGGKSRSDLSLDDLDLLLANLAEIASQAEGEIFDAR